MDVYEIRTNTKELLYKGEDYTLAVQSYYDFQEEAENDINSNLFGLEIIGYINGMKDKGLYEKGGKLTSGPIYKKGEAVTHDGKVYRVISVLRDSDNYFHYRISSDKTDMLVIKESELKSAKEHHESKIRSSANDMSKLLVVDKYAKTEADSLREDDMYEDDKKASIYVKEIESFINRNNYPKRMSMSSFKELEKYNNHLLNNALALLGRYGPEMANTYKDAYKESKNMYLNPKIITSGNKEKTYKEKIAILEMLQKDMKKDLSSTPKDLLKMEIRIEMLKEKSSEKFSKGGVLGYTLDINKIILNDKDRAIEIEQDALLRGIDVRRSGKIVTIRDFDKIDEVIALLKHNLSFAYPQTKLTFKKGGEISGRYSSVHDFVSRNKLEKEAENIFGKDWEPDDDMQQIRYLAGKNYGVEEIDYETLRDMRSDDYISVYRYDKGGEIDYFEQYELLQKDYPEIYNTVIEHGELTEYNDTERLLNKLNSKGWTFDYGLDNSPFNLRPFAPKMNWPNYEKGGALSKPGVFMVSGYWKDDKSEFNDYLISEYDDVPKGYDDDDIFYYGLSETNLKNSSENDGMEFVITEYRRLENYSQGGALSKEFKFDKNFVVYVPSTSDVSDKISPKELDDRVNEVKQYVANTFGGYTETETEGGYKSSKGDIVEEDVVKVSVFSKNKDWKDKEYEVVKKAKEWAREWGQEAIGFEYEGDLYYIDGEGKMEKGGIFGFGGTIDMPRGSGWGKYKKGERVLKIKDLKEGSNYLAYSDQFNAKNIVYIIPEGKSYLNESGSSMFTDKKVFAYVQPESLKKARSQSDVPLLISEDQLQDNYANYNFYEMKEKEETRRPIRIKRGRDHRGGLRKTYGFGKGGAIYKHAADIGVQYANEKSKDGELETPGMGGYDEAIMESQTDKAANTIVDAIPIAAPFKALGEAGSKAIIGDSKGDERKKKQVIAAGIFAPHKLFAMRKARDKARAEENQYKKGGLTPAKAKKILADGEANGKPLTDKQKRYFGYIAGGGKSYAEGGEVKETSLQFKKRSEKDSVRIYNAWKKVLDSDFGDKEYQRFEKLVKDTQIPQDSVEKITNYTSTTPRGKQRLIDIYQYWGKESSAYAEGGEIEERAKKYIQTNKLIDKWRFRKEYDILSKYDAKNLVNEGEIVFALDTSNGESYGIFEVEDFSDYREGIVFGVEKSSTYAEGGEIEIGDRVKVIDQDITGTIIRKDGVKNVLLDDDTSWAEEGEEATLIYKDYELEKYGVGGFLTGAVLGAVGGVYVTNKISKTTKKREADGKKAKAPKYLYQHPLWDNTIYKYLKEKKTSNKEIDKLWNKGLQNLPEYLKKRNKLKQSIK